MNIDDFKTMWKEYDRKIDESTAIHEKLMTSIIANRSDNRFTSVKRIYQLRAAWIGICLLVGSLVIIGNPFDYTHTVQYVPMMVFSLSLVVFLIDIILSYRALNKISVTSQNVRESLRSIIAIYEKPRKFVGYVLVTFLCSQLLMFPLTFLPVAKGVDWSLQLPKMIVPVSAGILTVVVGYLLGAFRSSGGEKFKGDLAELESLKRLSSELAE